MRDACWRGAVEAPLRDARPPPPLSLIFATCQNLQPQQSVQHLLPTLQNTLSVISRPKVCRVEPGRLYCPTIASLDLQDDSGVWRHDRAQEQSQAVACM